MYLPVVRRFLVAIALLLASAVGAHADRIRCSGTDCEDLRIDCSGSAPCFAGIHAEGFGGPFNVFVSRQPLVFDQIVVLERITNVLIRTGSGDDGIYFMDTHIPGTLRIDTGAGNDSVGWEDTGAQRLWIRTGGGDDDIFFDGGGLGFRSSIDLGAGDDFIHVSSGQAGPSTIDGGSGDDEGTIFVVPFEDPPAPRIRRIETMRQ